MIMEAKRWVQGVGLAALVLSGSALLDGNRIEAQEVGEPAEAPDWQRVTSVMEIDELPQDATWVDASGLEGAHLEFLAAHAGIRGLDFSRSHSVTLDHLNHLAAIKQLEYLDMAGITWSEDADYRVLTKLSALKKLIVDYIPRQNTATGSGVDVSRGAYVLEALSELGTRGVEVQLRRLDSLKDEEVREIVAALPAVHELDLHDNDRITASLMKFFADTPSVTSLDLTNCVRLEDLGMAYLAKANHLRKLSYGGKLPETDIYQIAKMTNLEELTLRSASLLSGEIAARLERLSAIQNLRVLRLSADIDSGRLRGAHGVELSKLAPRFPKLEEFSFVFYQEFDGLCKQLKSLEGIKARTLEIGGSLSVRHKDDGDLSWLNGMDDVDPLTGVETLVFHSFEFPYDAENLSAFSKLVARFPDLKSIQLVFGSRGYDGRRDAERDARIDEIRKVFPALTIEPRYE